MAQSRSAMVFLGRKYGLVAYGMAIFQSLKDIFQWPKFAGRSLKFRAERAVLVKFQAPNFEKSDSEPPKMHLGAQRSPS